MPTTLDGSLEHREKNVHEHPVTAQEITELMAMVARPVGRKELLGNPKAQASLDVEWDKPYEEEGLGYGFCSGMG